ncbi:50S ribosomal protein L18 [uncultured archaeon]|nr:50S ribosomal protein L18 [uncultured archaeon]
MATGPTYVVRYRRARSGRTNYKHRLNSLKGGMPRLVIRRTGHHIRAQIINYERAGDVVLAQASSDDIRKLGWSNALVNSPTAYLVGLLIAVRAKNAQVEEAIIDLGLSRSIKGNRLYAVVKGAVEGGLNVPHDKEALPSDDRTSGKIIDAYRKTHLTEDVAKIKEKILTQKSVSAE